MTFGGRNASLTTTAVLRSRVSGPDPRFCPACGTGLTDRRVEGRDRRFCPACERPVYRNPKPCAGVLVVDGGRLLLVERTEPPAVGAWSVPAGYLEADEPPRAAAARELREETGFDPDGVSLLAEFWTATGVLRHRRAVVFAEGLSPVDRELDANEFLTPRTVPVEDALDVARTPPANDATLEGVLLAREDGLL